MAQRGRSTISKLKRQFISAMYNRGRAGRYYRGTFTHAYIAKLTCTPVSTVQKIARGAQ